MGHEINIKVNFGKKEIHTRLTKLNLNFGKNKSRRPSYNLVSILE